MFLHRSAVRVGGGSVVPPYHQWGLVDFVPPMDVIVDLSTLMHHVAAVAGIERIRFTTSHPLEFSDSLIEAYASLPQLANHLHLPVQSGSDRILALMKRGY